MPVGPARPTAERERKWSVSKWAPGAAPKPERRARHPSLMRQFQFQSRLPITETGTVSRPHLSNGEDLTVSVRYTHGAFDTVPTTPRSVDANKAAFLSFAVSNVERIHDGLDAGVCAPKGYNKPSYNPMLSVEDLCEVSRVVVHPGYSSHPAEERPSRGQALRRRPSANSLV